MLDGIAADLGRLDPGAAAATALTLARAGRALDLPAIEALAARLDHDAARPIRLAAALVRRRPPATLERADAGYRFTDGDEVLFVEDPVAAHWHRSDRWGPPLRPDLDRAPVLARGDPRALVECALDGGVVVVALTGGGPALRVTRAGFSRDASLRSIVRWPAVRALRLAERGTHQRIEVVLVNGAPESIRGVATLEPPALLDFMAQVRSGALSRSA